MPATPPFVEKLREAPHQITHNTDSAQGEDKALSAAAVQPDPATDGSFREKISPYYNDILVITGILGLLVAIWALRKKRTPPKIIPPSFSTEDSGKPPLPDHIQKTPFFGRKKEIEDLSTFASEDTRKFSWWMVCGAGGTGKSRLASEFTSRLAEKPWHAGFIDLGKTPRVTWDTWKPDKPTVIIVDNAARFIAAEPDPLDDTPKPADLFSILTILSAQADAFKHPVRLLLLERAYKQQEAKEEGPTRQQAITTVWFERLKKLKAFCHDPDALPLELNTLGDLELLNIAREKLGPDTPKDFVATLENIDPLKRPLFAEYLALYLLEGSMLGQHNVTQEKLLRFMLEREATTRWSHVKLDQHEFKAIMLATLCSSDYKVQLDRQKILANHEIGFFNEQVFHVRPLKPDILGEFCLLNGGMGTANADYWLPTGSQLEEDNALKKLVLEAWAINPAGVAAFFARCGSDFLENSNLPRLLSYLPQEKEQQLYWARAAMEMGG
ncbi:ATP-binding protein, partial [Desulfosarcina sp. OttesenSCG-928-A07]|nr:ATP-binding protein [Desulfosarcina sp. OttesenSCG-928-G17]MDL2328996.1 ATP-binding protein [Desulfosarcina sp. OttesenSCG-928-A07]